MSHGIRFEHRSGPTWADPWTMYAALRDHDPVHHVVPPDAPDDDYYVLSRYADVHRAVRDHETFSSAKGLTTDYRDLAKTGLPVEHRPFVMTDPPEHTDFRRLVSKGFTPRQVATVEPAVRAFVVARLDDLAAAGGGDIMELLFTPMPGMVVAHYLGVPEADRGRFTEWADAIIAATAADEPIGAQTAIVELMGYFGELVERRRTEPGDDTISHLVAAGLGAPGDVAGLLSILGFAFTTVIGGSDTTSAMLGGAVQLLEQRRDQRRLLLDDAGLIPDAVEELLRLTSPLQGTARTLTRDVEIAGVRLPAGRRALLLYASANRDEREFGSDAAELDVLRRPRQILAFGHGAHHCLGAAAARMQAGIALRELLARFPDFEVELAGVEFAEGGYVRRPSRVPFRT